ncbi:unnamed protein product, partial [Mesorhabditis spiculigera]
MERILRSTLALLAFRTLLVTASEAIKTEQELVQIFMNQEDVHSSEELHRIIGPLKEIPDYRHWNYDELTQYLKGLNKQFPNLTHLYSAGRSVEGRELWVFCISKSPNRHAFVDTTRIHLMPSMNPDGYEESVEGADTGKRGRENANRKDLNRNFPTRFPNYFPSQNPEPETLAMMSWSKSLPFVLSANLHGGSMLVNYPFDDAPTRVKDSKYTPSPDNALFVRLAYSYAKAHDRMWKQGPRCIDEELNSPGDPKYGIVNGAEWYIVSGGMQDWNYVHTNCFEVTVETNCAKFPKKEEMRWLWKENNYAMLHYISLVHNAISGFIYDMETGQGIPNATVSIDFRSKIITSYEGGEFWRLANIGDYEVTFDHPEYIPVTRKVSLTKEKRSARLEVGLARIPSEYAHDGPELRSYDDMTRFLYFIDVFK